MIKRTVLRALLALTVVAVPVSTASADHATDSPCDSTHDLGADVVNVVSGSVTAADFDVWRDPDGIGTGNIRSDYIVVADGPFNVSSHSVYIPGGCLPVASCEALTAPYVCHIGAVAFGSKYITVSTGEATAVNYDLVRVTR